jgi:GNAT superfamily N-acetyltransferase
MSAPSSDVFDISAVADDEAGQVLALINTVQPHVPWSVEQYDWQYRQNPAGKSQLFAARHDGRVVSFYAAVVQRFQLGERLIQGWMVQDVMTHPDYRGRGLLHKLGEVCLQALRAEGAIGYAFPNNQSEKSFLRLGWHEWGAVPWWRADVRDIAPSALAALAPVEEFDASATAIWLNSGLTFGIRRDAAHLEWR